MGRVSMLNARAGGLLERPGRRVGHARGHGSLSLRSFIPAVDFRAGPVQLGFFTGIWKNRNDCMELSRHAACGLASALLTRALG